MEKLETIITNVLAEIEPKHTKGTFENRKRALNHLLRFAQENGYDEPCQELYDAFTADDRGSPDIRFTLTHAVRLVDRAADTRAKDNSGRLYNEPPLPSAEESLQYFSFDSKKSFNPMYVPEKRLCLNESARMRLSVTGLKYEG